MAKKCDHKRVFASDADKKGMWVCKLCMATGKSESLKDGYRSGIDWINQSMYSQLKKEKLAQNQEDNEN
jgi:hypothetical protein